MPYTREEYIQKYGYDPELDHPIDPSGDESKPGVARNVISTVTSEIGSLPTLALSAPQELLAAGKAAYTAYTQDENFFKEFQRERMNDDAQKNIDEHLKHVARTWAQQEPDLSEEDLGSSLQNYMKSKEFEDYTSSQLSGAIWLNNRWKDTIRGVQGDERTEAERPMWEDILGIASTAGIGTSAKLPLAAANMAAKVGGVTNALVNNPVTRGTLKTAELLTPVTIPYTPANAALNFGIGVAIDQGARYGQGQETMFTVPDDSGVKAMAATGLGIGGILATVAAVRGRTVAALNAAKSDTARGLANNAVLDRMVADPMRPGEAGIVAGPEQQLHPPSYVETLPLHQRIGRTATYQGIDQNSMLISTIRDQQGYEAASRIEGNMSMMMGTIGRDRRINQTATLMQPIHDVINAMPEQEARAAQNGIDMSSYKAELKMIREFAVDKIDTLTKEVKEAKTPQVRGMKKKELELAKDDLRRFDNDEESARPKLPHVPMKDAIAQGTLFENDTSPHMMKVKEVVKAFNRKILDEQVKAGKLTKYDADKMHARNPYYVQTVSDPLKGDVGGARVWRSVNQAADKSVTEATSSGTQAMMRESPIEKLDLNIRRPKADDLETRVTTQLNTRSSMQQYAEHHVLDVNYTRSRTEALRNLMFKDGVSSIANNETDFYKNGHARIVKVDGKEWVKGVREKDADVMKILDNPRTAREWQNGEFRIWEVGDVSIAAALRAEPVFFHGLVRAISKPTNLYKSLTTGFGNPFFAPINAYYDASVGMVTAPRSYGALRYLNNRFLPPKVALWANRLIPDPTPLVLWPIYSMKAFIDITATRTARAAGKMLEAELGSNAIRAAMGDKAFDAIMAQSLKASAMTHELATNHAFRQGFSRSGATVDSISKVRGHFEMATDRMPRVLRNIIQLWKDGVNAVYLGPKIQYYLENRSLLRHQYRNEKGGIPQVELEKLDYDVHGLGGHMDKVAANNFIRQTEAATPYATQTKLGVYNLYRNLKDPEVRLNTWARAFQMMTLYGMGQYMMNTWNDQSREELNRQGNYERYRFLYIPSITLLLAWFRGENPAYSRDLIYRIPIAPDLVGLTAGASAFMEMTGIMPVGEPKPMAPNYPSIVLESMLPAMPPVAQIGLAFSGMRLDPQTADRRGGNWIRSFNDAYRGGPDAEAATSLGEVSTTTSLLMNALFGVLGGHLAIATDALLHASKYQPTIAGDKLPRLREQRSFAEGLKAAVGELSFRGEKKIPDIPLLWQNKDKYTVMTPAWQYVGEAGYHLKSIKGMATAATSKTEELKRQVAASGGGMPKQVLQDAALITMAIEWTKFQSPTGELGKLKNMYKQMGDANAKIMANYNLSHEERSRKGNMIIRQQQDNMRQQYLAILYKEQETEQKYGMYIKPMLKGRGITVSSIDALLRESMGSPARQSATESTAQEAD